MYNRLDTSFVLSVFKNTARESDARVLKDAFRSKQVFLLHSFRDDLLPAQGCIFPRNAGCIFPRNAAQASCENASWCGTCSICASVPFFWWAVKFMVPSPCASIEGIGSVCEHERDRKRKIETATTISVCTFSPSPYFRMLRVILHETMERMCETRDLAWLSRTMKEGVSHEKNK